MTHPNPNLEQELINILKELDAEIKQTIVNEILTRISKATEPIQQLEKRINHQEKVINSLQKELNEIKSHSSLQPKTYEDYKARILTHGASINSMSFQDFCEIVEGDASRKATAVGPDELITLLFLVTKSGELRSSSISKNSNQLICDMFNSFLKSINCQSLTTTYSDTFSNPITTVNYFIIIANKYKGSTKLHQYKLDQIASNIDKLIKKSK